MARVNIRHYGNIRRRLLVTLILLLLLGGASLCVLKILYPTVVTLDCGSGRSIVITTNVFWEYLQPLYYEIWEEDTKLVDRTFFASFHPIPKLHLVQSEDGTIAGVYYEPGRSLAGFPDCEAGETWTRKILKDHMILLHDFKSHEVDGAVPSDRGAFDRLFAVIEESYPKWRTDDPSSSVLLSTESVEARENATISDAQLRSLLSLRNLKYLHLYKSSVDDASLQVIGQLVELRGLTLEATKITDEGLPHLGELKKLEWISLFGTEVTDAGVDALQESLPTCRIGIDTTEILARP